MYLCHTACSYVAYFRPDSWCITTGDSRCVIFFIFFFFSLFRIHEIPLLVCWFCKMFSRYYIFKIYIFFVKKVFCGSVGTGLSMCFVHVGVRSCTSGSPHTPHKRELFGSCCCCCCIGKPNLPTRRKSSPYAHDHFLRQYL